MLAGAAFCGVTFGANAFADEPPRAGPPPHEAMMRAPMGAPGVGLPNPRMLMRIADELGLTEAQRTKIKTAFDAARPEMQKLREQLRDASKGLRELNASDAQYLTKAGEASKRIGDLTARMVLQGAQLRSAVWQALTPEQRTKLEERMAKMRERMRERTEDRHGGWGHHRGEGRGMGGPGMRGPDGPPPPRGN